MELFAFKFGVADLLGRATTQKKSRGCWRTCDKAGTNQRGSADLGENRRIWGVRRTGVRRSPKSAVEKARMNLENFEEIQPITVSFSDRLENGTFSFLRGLFRSRQM